MLTSLGADSFAGWGISAEQVLTIGLLADCDSAVIAGVAASIVMQVTGLVVRAAGPAGR